MKNMKIMIIVVLSFFVMFPAFGYSEYQQIANGDLVACKNYLQEAKIYVDADWNKTQIEILCVNLISEGHIYIEREGKRDISLNWVKLGTTVKITL